MHLQIPLLLKVWARTKEEKTNSQLPDILASYDRFSTDSIGLIIQVVCIFKKDAEKSPHRGLFPLSLSLYPSLSSILGEKNSNQFQIRSLIWTLRRRVLKAIITDPSFRGASPAILTQLNTTTDATCSSLSPSLWAVVLTINLNHGCNFISIISRFNNHPQTSTHQKNPRNRCSYR